MPAELTTGRLLLRPLSFPDADAALSVWRATGPPLPVAAPATVADARSVIATVIGLYAAWGHGPFAVVTARDSALVGDCGLFPVAGGPDERELAYRLAPGARGHGYATEAARAVVDAASAAGVTRVVADVAPGNVGSRRVVERLGMAPGGRDGAEVRWSLDLAPRSVDGPVSPA